MIPVLALIALGIHSMGLIFCKDRWLKAWCTGCIVSCSCYLLVSEAWIPAVTVATWTFYLTYWIVRASSFFVARFVRKELEKQRAVLVAEIERTQKPTMTVTWGVTWVKKPRKPLTAAHRRLGIRSETAIGQAVPPSNRLSHQRSRNAKKQPRKGGKFVCKSPRKR